MRINAMADMLGVSVRDLISRPFEKLIHPQDRKLVMDRHQRRMNGDGRPDSYPFRALTAGGAAKWLMLSVVSISWENQPAALLFFTDIDTQKKTEEEKGILEKQLRQAQKLEAIGTLAGGIAHDFNNILSAIIGYAELSLAMAGDHPNLRGNLEGILKAGCRATDLVSRILTFSRQTEHELKPHPGGPHSQRGHESATSFHTDHGRDSDQDRWAGRLGHGRSDPDSPDPDEPVHQCGPGHEGDPAAPWWWP